MRLNLLFAVVWLLRLCWCQQDHGATADNVFSAALDEFPSCSIKCIVSAVASSICASTDTACICASKIIEAKSSLCIQRSCTLDEALHSKKLADIACHRPTRDRAYRYDAMNIAFGVVTVIVATARLLFKRLLSKERELLWDDWVILAATVIVIPAIILNVKGLTAHGLGKDVWAVEPSHLTKFARYFYTLQIIYLAEISFIKLSLSLFYLRIFPGTIVHRLLLFTVFLNIAYGITFIIIAIFQCIPVSYYWENFVGNSSSGRCISVQLFSWTNAALGISIDIWMITIPLTQLGKLNLHWKQKIAASIMFLTGTFVTIVSVLRLRSLIVFENISNPTWEQWNVAWWSTIEINTGIICVCLPTLRLILDRMAPKRFCTNPFRKQHKTRCGYRCGGYSYHSRHKHIELPRIEMNFEGVATNGEYS